MTINLKTFAKNLTYQVNTSDQTILSDFQELELIKKLAKDKLTFLNPLTSLVFFFFILVLIVAGVSTRGTPVEGLGLSLFAISVTIFTILAFLTNKIIYYKRLELPNYRYELPKKILAMTKRDRIPKSNISIFILFSSLNKLGEKIQTVPHPFKKDWKVDIFEDLWLIIRGKLVDGTGFFLSITESNKKIYGQNASGKFKTKNKPRGTEINLQLSFSRKKYGTMKSLEQAAQSAVKLPKKTQLKKLKVTEKAISLTVYIPPVSFEPIGYSKPAIYDQNLIYETTVMIFLSLYQVLNFAKILTRRRQVLS